MSTAVATLAAILLAGSQSAFPGDGKISTNSDNVHDPTVISFKGHYFCFSTNGNGFALLRSSTDLKHWKIWGPVLPETPEWARKKVGHSSVWAPDIVILGSKLRMYYAVSRWGTNDSGIGMAECDSFDPEHPLTGWQDRGEVFQSRPGIDTYNAIDPEVTTTPDGHEFMFFGSYFSGIQEMELDPTSGKPLIGSVPKTVARNLEEKGDPLEGAAVCHANGYYYLFVSYGLAAQGVRSTYRMMVGRSPSPNGPFTDRSGKDMADGGHENMLKTSPPMFSPGHSDVFQDPAGKWLMPYHFYDGRKYWGNGNWGRPQLQIRELLWSKDGWPLPGLPVECNELKQKHRDAIGNWTCQNDFGEPFKLQIKPNGSVASEAAKGTWTRSGNYITLNIPDRIEGAELVLSNNCNYLVGRTARGTILRAVRSSIGDF